MSLKFIERISQYVLQVLFFIDNFQKKIFVAIIFEQKCVYQKRVKS